MGPASIIGYGRGLECTKYMCRPVRHNIFEVGESRLIYLSGYVARGLKTIVTFLTLVSRDRRIAIGFCPIF
jgi:hypothetical protein